MIVNLYSILMLFMAALGLLLAVVLAAAALRTGWLIHVRQGEQEEAEVERRIYWARLVAAGLLGLTVLGWPLFYAMLASFVPEVPGAMCIYGVTRVMPGVTAVLQATRPAVLFLLGAWLLVDYAYRQSGRRYRWALGMGVLAGVAVVALLASAADLYYVLNMESLNEVSCCSSYGESESARLQAPSYYLPWLVPGRLRGMALAVLFFGGLPVLALVMAMVGGLDWHRWRWPAVVAGSVGLLASAAVLGFSSLLAFAQVLAPRLMRLPFHHCLYCLVGNGRAVESPLILANLAAGIMCAGWAAVLAVSLRAGLGGPPGWRLYRRLCLLGTTTLLACVLMVVSHLAAQA